MMLLTPRQESALFAVICSGCPSMADLVEIQSLQAALTERVRIRRHLDHLSKLQQETRR